MRADDLGELVERFSRGRLSATDLIRIVGAGLRGAGHAIADEAVRAMQADNGAAGFATIVAELLTATFGAAPKARRETLDRRSGRAERISLGPVMAAGFGLLRLSPKTFWSMTPRELERAMSVLAPASRAAHRDGASLPISCGRFRTRFA